MSSPPGTKIVKRSEIIYAGPEMGVWGSLGLDLNFSPALVKSIRGGEKKIYLGMLVTEDMKIKQQALDWIAEPW